MNKKVRNIIADAKDDADCYEEILESFLATLPESGIGCAPIGPFVVIGMLGDGNAVYAQFDPDQAIQLAKGIIESAGAIVLDEEAEDEF
jgi:hypothetical protein